MLPNYVLHVSQNNHLQPFYWEQIFCWRLFWLRNIYIIVPLAKKSVLTESLIFVLKIKLIRLFKTSLMKAQNDHNPSSIEERIYTITKLEFYSRLPLSSTSAPVFTQINFTGTATWSTSMCFPTMLSHHLEYQRMPSATKCPCPLIKTTDTIASLCTDYANQKI